VNQTAGQSVRIIGLDPGLRHTGWGMVEATGNRLRHLGDGVVSTDDTLPVAERLVQLHRALTELLATWTPDEAAVEETYVNKNPGAALKLGQARGVVLLAPALSGIPVREYGAMLVKQSVVGTGAASKDQVQAMVRRLLPGCLLKRSDAADALAVGICHAHHRATRLAWAKGRVPA
jgi:crossover junction endodeoxyribonuclease RuvC